MRRMVVEQEANPGMWRITLVQFAQQGDEVHAGVMVAYDLGDAACVEIQACQQRYRSQSPVLVVAKMAAELPRCRRQIGRCRRKSLNTGLLVIGDRDHRWLFQRALDLIDDLHPLYKRAGRPPS